jgi:toxin ParE1/3/4
MNGGRKVEISSLADGDIDRHFNASVSESLDSAVKFYDAIFQTCDDLLSMPLMGRESEYRTPKLSDMRQWRVKGFPKYLIFYRPMTDGIEVIRILHGASDLESTFLEEDDGGT